MLDKSMHKIDHWDLCNELTVFKMFLWAAKQTKRG